jgi:hypothetical protein
MKCVNYEMRYFFHVTLEELSLLSLSHSHPIIALAYQFKL